MVSGIYDNLFSSSHRFGLCLSLAEKPMGKTKRKRRYIRKRLMEKNEPDYSALYTVSARARSYHLPNSFRQKRKRTHRAENRLKR